jgi:hypothetical protein
MKKRFVVNSEGNLVAKDGQVLGRVVGITIDLGSEEPRGPGGEEVSSQQGTSVVSSSDVVERRTLEGGVGGTSERSSEIGQVWATYERCFPKKRVKLDPKLRRIISRALDVRSVKTCCQAVEGLLRDRWCMDHKPRPYDGIAYALSAIGKESVEERIDRMAAQACERIRGQPDSRSGLVSPAEFADTLPSGARETFWMHVRNVVKMRLHPDHPTLSSIGRPSEAHLALRHGVEVVGEDGALRGLKRLPGGPRAPA